MSSKKKGGPSDILPKDINELTDEIPYFKIAKKAFQFVQGKRISWFLKSINLASSEFDEKKKKKFETYINSNIGYELLAEYSDTVLRTSSKITISALGILYADSDNLSYSEEFKRIACFAFQGSTDELIETFIALSALEISRQGGPYSLCELSKELYEQTPELNRTIKSAEDAFASINELIRRGMFLPDHTPSRVSGGGWFIVFGITDVSLRLREILLKAKSFISKEYLT